MGRKAEDYRKRQRREGEIMRESAISDSQDVAQNKTSGSVGRRREKTLIILVCINFPSIPIYEGSLHSQLSCYINMYLLFYRFVVVNNYLN